MRCRAGLKVWGAVAKKLTVLFIVAMRAVVVGIAYFLVQSAGPDLVLYLHFWGFLVL